MPKSIILIGLGPHARRIYYPLLEKYAECYQIRIPLIIDLQDQQETIQRYLANRSLQPESTCFLDTALRNQDELSPDVALLLDSVVCANPGCSLILSTEAKAHKPYLLWAIAHNVDVLMDKPISTPVGAGIDVDAARQIFTDYCEIEAALCRSSANVIVQCQRRSHPGYQLVHDYLVEFIQNFQVPLSYLDIHHADGMWCMPSEFFSRENHPYKYGYGKLMHSGYHFVDLAAWLLGCNDMLETKRPEHAELFVKSFRPYDFLHQLNAEDYVRLFQTDRFDCCFSPEQLQQTRHFGEMDSFVLCQLKRDDAVMSTLSLNLQQNSFSRRSWCTQPLDTYKGNGRVRHEQMSLQVGNLLNIQVHSYQAYETKRSDLSVAAGEVGHEDHFDVLVFRNSGVVGGQSMEKFSVGAESRVRHTQDSTYLGHNEHAREVQFCDFLQGNAGQSHFSSHRFTNQLLSQIYTCMAQEQQGVLPHTQFGLDVGMRAKSACKS